MKKLMVIIGTRPEAIKMAPLINRLKESPEYKVFVCVTAQHREMLDQVLDLFEINSQFDLDLMKQNQSLAALTAEILQKLQLIFQQLQPDMIFVHGDTTTTLTASLAAFYHRIPVLHVEAGLRTWNISAPWPEELNRKVTACIAYRHYAPTTTAKNNLLVEGINEANIIVTGNTVIDALLLAQTKIDNVNTQKKLQHQFNFIDKRKKIILVTGHRRENFGVGFENICKALLKISHLKNVQIVYPVHLNPNVQQPVSEFLGSIENIFLIDPVDYLSFVYLMTKAYLILTDSGGVQEEAPALGKPVLVLREVTERPEAVTAGTVRLVGTDAEQIYQQVNSLLEDNRAYEKMSFAHNPYGDGKACERIIDDLRTYLT